STLQFDGSAFLQLIAVCLRPTTDTSKYGSRYLLYNLACSIEEQRISLVRIQTADKPDQNVVFTHTPQFPGLLSWVQIRTEMIHVDSIRNHDRVSGRVAELNDSALACFRVADDQVCESR